jgi:hypothetical protein
LIKIDSLNISKFISSSINHVVLSFCSWMLFFRIGDWIWREV